MAGLNNPPYEVVDCEESTALKNLLCNNPFKKLII